ncbi:hypothetical protein D3C81_1992890 [compost metagenome]
MATALASHPANTAPAGGVSFNTSKVASGVADVYSSLAPLLRVLLAEDSRRLLQLGVR